MKQCLILSSVFLLISCIPFSGFKPAGSPDDWVHWRYSDKLKKSLLLYMIQIILKIKTNKKKNIGVNSTKEKSG